MQKTNLLYGLFLVFITPLGFPLAYLSILHHQVSIELFIFCFFYYILTGLGVTVGYHRLVTHNSFEAKPWVKMSLLILGAMSMQGPPAAWASLHIQHHVFSDKLGDPHTPTEGFWHSHIGWIFTRYTPNFRKYGKGLLRDKAVMHVSQYYHYYGLLGLLIPVGLFGWPGLVWGGLIRLFIVCHATWAINSVCHRFGSRPYETPDNSRNHTMVAILSLGEGWHNNHHRAMQKAYFGEQGHQIDVGKYLIMGLARLGLVWNVKQ